MRTPSPADPTPPVAHCVPVQRTHHGDTFTDDFEWLRDKESPETAAYLEAENAYTAAMTAHLEGLRQQIFSEIKSRTKETDLTVPHRIRSYWYYARTDEGSQYAVYCRLPVGDPDEWDPPELVPGQPDPREHVLFDCNELAQGHDFFSLGAFAVSADERYLAYSTDLVGDERFTVRVLDTETGDHLMDAIDGTLGDVVWSADGGFLFYATVDDAWRPDKVWRHRIGTASSDDTLVLHEADERFWLDVSSTTSDRFLLISSASRVTTEVLAWPTDEPLGEPRPVFAREEGVEYDVEHIVVGGEDRWVVLHNKGAVDFALATGPMGAASIDDLEPLVPETPGVRLSSVHASRRAIAVGLRSDGLARVRVLPVTPDGIGPGRDIAFDEPEFKAVPGGFVDWECPLVRLSYESWLRPRTVIEHDPATGRSVTRKRVEVNGYDAGQLTASRHWVRSRDGVDIPLSLVHHRDMNPQSGAPLVLYGYGSYEISSDPRFQVPVLSLLERGFVFAVAHVRGGGELGRRWYDDGKLLAKRHTFDDFVDCARYLVDSGWTRPERLAAHGGSAGGLLMGAVANQAPELFGAIVAHVPFVDALTTILDPTLPLTVQEWEEWGDPLHDADVYRYMKSYTPYENVRAVPYPAIYALTSINDTRVYYVEPAKWVAQLRRTVTGGGPILLKCETSAGHGGASGRYDAWRETADYLAWVVDAVGIGHESRHAVGPPAAD